MSGGSYTVRWSAADPEVNKGTLAPTYAKLTPAEYLATYGSYPVGFATDPLPNAESANPAGANDSVPSLAPKGLEVGQIVPFFLTVTVNGSTLPENGTITINPYWLTKTTNGGDFGFDPNYKILAAFVDRGDPVYTDPGQNATVSGFTSTVANVGTSNEQIQGAITLTGLNNGDRVTVEVWVVLKDTLPPGGVSGNVQTGVLSAATINQDTINVGNQTVSLLRAQDFYNGNADLSIIKSDNAASITAGQDVDPVLHPGDTFTYYLKATNLSTDTSSNGVVVTDTLPAGVTFLSASAGGTISGSTVSWSLGGISPQQTIDLAVTVRVNETTTGGTILSNTASISAITPDSNTANNTNVENTTVVAPLVVATADLSVIKSDNAASVTAGQDADPVVYAGSTYTYTIRAANAGTDPAANVVVTDTLPDGVTFLSASNGGTLSGNTVTWNTGTLAAGASATYTVTVQVNSTLSASTLTNSASVTSTTFDPNTANNSNSEDTVVRGSADLSVIKSDNAGSVTAGQDADPVVYAGSTYTYTIVAANAGNDAASNVVVTDTLPAGVSFVSATGGGTASGNTVTWNTGTLAAGASTTYTVTVRVNDATLAGTLTNTASITAATFDPNTANNSNSENTVVRASADLSVIKSDNAASVTAGQDADPVVYAGSTYTYTIRAANAGNDAAANVVVTDTLPAGVTFLSATGGGTASGNTVTWNTGTLAAGASTTYTVTVRVNDATLAGTLTNTASITSTTLDANTANNSNSENTAVLASVDLSVIKSDNPTSITAGQDADPTLYSGSTFTYTIRAANAGNDAAANVVVTDTLPAGVTFLSATGGGTLSGNTVTWNTGTLAAGASTTYTVTVQVDDATPAGTLSNTASITSTTRDPNAANNSNSESTVTLGPQPRDRADLFVIKTDSASAITAGNDPEPVLYAGSTFTYTIRAGNAGPDAAANVMLTDTLPAGVTLIYVSGTSMVVGDIISWSIGSLAAGATQDFTVTVRVNDDTRAGTLTNHASVTSTTDEPNDADNTNSEDTVILASADLSVIKSDNAGSVTAGQDADPVVYAGSTFTYTIKAMNAGLDAAANVVVTDTLPTGVSFVSATGGGTLTGNTVTWNAGTLAAGASTTYTVTVRVNDATAAGTLVNTASVTSTTRDPNTANNSNSENTTVLATEVPSFVVSKLTNGYDGADILAGQPITWTYAVTNTGTVAVSNIIVSDDQEGLVNQFVGGDSNSNQRLDPGETWTYSATGTAVSGSYSNLATVTGSFVPPNGTPVPTSAQDSSSYNGVTPSFSVVKYVSTDGGATFSDADTAATAPVAFVGVNPIFRYVVTNTGDVGLYNLSLSDDMLDLNGADPGGSVTIASLPVGASASFNVTGSWASGLQTNISTVTGSYTDALGNTVPLTSSNPANYVGAVPGTVSGSVFLDLPPGICNYKLPDAVFEGVKVELITAAGVIVGTTATDATGAYHFDTVAPGSYIIRFTNPDGTVFTQPKVAGTLNPRDSDANPNGLTDVFTVGSGQDVTQVNAGLDYASVGFQGQAPTYLPDGGGSYNFQGGAYAIGGNGSYALVGNGGAPVYFIGGSGNNNLQGSGANGAILVGGGGFNIMEGTGGRDIIIGGCGPNNFQGLGSNNFQGLGGGNGCWNYDLLIGGISNDVITSNSGNAIITGNKGDDALDGQGVFVGGPNNGTVSFNGTSITGYTVGDHLKLTGLSQVNYQVGDGVQWIENFNPGRGDTIEVYGYAAPTATGVVNGQYVLYFGPNAALIIGNYQPQNGVPLTGINYHPDQDSMPGAFGHLDALPPVILAAGQDSFTGTQGDDIAIATDAFTTFLGNAGDDIAFGGEGGNLFVDGAGNDSYIGGGGNDIFRLTQGSNQVIGCEGNNVVQFDVARAQATVTQNPNGTFTVRTPDGEQVLKDIQWLSFTDENVHLPGVADAPGAMLFGTAGNDQFFVTDARDLIVERPGQGTDTAWISADGWTVSPGLENARLIDTATLLYGNASDNVLVANPTKASTLVGGGGSDELWGSSANGDVLIGGAGDDVIRSGTGTSSMIGGTGNDQYVVNNAGDTITELAGQGTDTAWVGVNGWTVGNNVEIVRLFGVATSVNVGTSSAQVVANGGGNTTIVAQLGDNVFYSQAGNDTFVGGAGNDVFYAASGGAGTKMVGGAGHDAFVVKNLGDQAFENAGEGYDTAYVAVDGWTVGDNIEVAYLSGIATTITGNATGGNLVANITAGSTLTAGAGLTTFWGSSFADTFNAGPGGSTIYGYGGADEFHFGVVSWGLAEIADFSQAEGDKLNFQGSGLTFADLTITNYADKVQIKHEFDEIILYGVTAPLVATDFVF